MDDDKEQRPVKDLMSLLCLSTGASSTSSGTANEVSETDVNRNEWLQDAINELSESVVEQMSKCLESMKLDLAALDSNPCSEIFGSLEISLDSLMQHTDSIDNANDFFKIGGFDVLPKLLILPHPGVKAKTAELIADLVQNNLYCQNKVLESGFLPLLLQMLDDDPDEMVNIKALYAVSCICRQNPNILHYLNEYDGFSVLLRAIQKPVEKLQTKAAFLLTHLFNQLPEIRDILHKMGIVAQLCSLLQCEYEASHEHLLSALLALVSQHEPSLKECSEPKCFLKGTLERNIEFFEGKEEFREANEYCVELCDLCFINDSFEELER